MKKISLLLAILITFTSFVIPAKAQTASAKGSSRADFTALGQHGLVGSILSG